MSGLFGRIGPRDEAPPAAGGSSNMFGPPPPSTSASSIFTLGAGAGTGPGSTSSRLSGSTLVPPSGGSLFGQPAAISAAPSASNLFGQPANSQAPSGSSIFGQPASSQPPAGGSLFGGQPSSSQAPAPSLFGGMGNQPASSFGQPATTIAGPANSSLFGDGVLPKAEPPNAPLNPGGAPPQPAYFDALLQRGRKRQKDEKVNGFSELPQLQLGLQDISRKVRNLGQGGPSAGLARGGDTRAHYLLSASGVNTGQALRDLDELAGSVKAPEQPELTYPSGVKETLAQKYENDFQKMVDAHVQRAQNDFNRMIDERLHGVDWDAHRQRIYEHFGLKKPQDLGQSAAGAVNGGSFGSFSRRSRNGAPALEMTRSIIGTPGPTGARKSVFHDVAEKMPVDGIRPAPEDRVLRNKQKTYANRVKDLNEARLNERAYPILRAFEEVEAEPSTEDTTMLVNAFNALIQITGENAEVDNIADPRAIKERAYAAQYLDDNANSQNSTRIRRRIITGSRKFLEKLFYNQVESSVSRNPREANLGGVPSAIAKVKGYVRVRAARKELGPDLEILQEVNGDYCWPVLYYLLRSGLYQEALEYVDENAAAFRQIDRSFVRYLRAYVTSDEHRLPGEMQTSINNEYSARSRIAPEDSIDPYRMVCYKIIGRCELQKRNLDGISNDMMDWMWLQYALAREYNRVDEFAHEAFGLDELRLSIKEIGERYFGPGSEVANAPTTLFFMQTLAGLFEKAVADLYPHNYVSATHFAIALDYYGLLRVSDPNNSDDLLSYTTRQQPQIAFGSLMGLYTRDFRTADATAAVDYVVLICLNGNLSGQPTRHEQQQRTLCHQALVEIVLETREFAQLLGDIRSDGQRIKGTIEQRLKIIGLDDERGFMRNITLVAARTAEEQSRVTDAALLFHLAEDYDKVVQVVNDAVSLALTTELGEEPARLTPLKPRTIEPQNAQQQNELSSLSLTAVDDPIVLARNMVQLYSSKQMYDSKIKDITRDSATILLQLADARAELEAGNWPSVIDSITHSRLLPTHADGNMTAIRNTAQAFNQLPPVVARTVGYVMVWTVIACSNNVEKLKTAEFSSGAQQDTIQRCVRTSKDVMVFAGLIRFKLPGRVWEMLARIGGDLGAF